MKIYISSSISNFKEKLLKRFNCEEYRGLRDINEPTIFIGLYHWRDWFRFLRHRGKKKTLWCGSDILALGKHPIWSKLIAQSEATHYCENRVERAKLYEYGIESEIRPMIFDDPNQFEINYKWSAQPKYFATYHKGREDEYGYMDHPMVDFLTGYSEKQFNEKIKNYQGAIRFNYFDGFAESLAKSALMGQYPVSRIEYPYIRKIELGIDYTSLPKEPNYEGREYWLNTLENNLKVIKTF